MPDNVTEYCENCAESSSNVPTDDQFKAFVLQALCQIITLLEGLQAPE